MKNYEKMHQNGGLEIIPDESLSDQICGSFDGRSWQLGLFISVHAFINGQRSFIV